MTADVQKLGAAPGLSRADILAADDRAIERVHVPQWGGAVRVQELSVRELVSWQTEFGFGMPGGITAEPEQLSVALVVRSVIDDKGALMFTADDVGALLDKSAAAVQLVYGACLKVNGLGLEVDEDAEKN